MACSFWTFLHRESVLGTLGDRAAVSLMSKKSCWVSFTPCCAFLSRPRRTERGISPIRVISQAQTMHYWSLVLGIKWEPCQSEHPDRPCWFSLLHPVLTLRPTHTQLVPCRRVSSLFLHFLIWQLSDSFITVKGRQAGRQPLTNTRAK